METTKSIVAASAIVGATAYSAYVASKIYKRMRNVLTLGEEGEAKEFISSLSNDDFASDVFEDGEIKELCEEFVPLGDSNFRTVAVRKAIEAIKSEVGPMKKTPAARLVVEREYRKWAKNLGLRPSHIAVFRPYVLVGYFVNSIHELRANAIENSLAAACNDVAVDRWSALRWLSGWAPSMGSTVE